LDLIIATAGDQSAFVIGGDQGRVRPDLNPGRLRALPGFNGGINPRALPTAETTIRVAIKAMALAEARTKVTE
jgi:hypothetical protein